MALPSTDLAPPPASKAASQPSPSAPPASAASAPPSPAAPAGGDVPAPPVGRPAHARLFEDLRKLAKPTNAPADAAPATAPAPESKPPVTAEAGEPKLPPATQPPADAKKPNPWRLVDDYKSKVSTLEKELAEAKKGSGFEEERKTLTDKLSATEKRFKELDDHIRFLDYTKSEEFRTKYQEPYENAWKRALSDLSELTVTNQNTGESRPISPDDILQLVNMPLTKAREVALNMFGDFADDVMAHRKEIRKLFDEQSAALVDAKKNGAERIRQAEENARKMAEEISNNTVQLWEKHARGTLADPKYGKYFTPVEGDEQGNQRLAKGYELVDRAFRENPMDPSLTAEQRESVVRRHVAVRNRAAAFGKLVHMLNQATERITELEKNLGQYQQSVPGTGDGKGSGQGSENAPRSARDDVFAALRARAKPI